MRELLLMDEPDSSNKRYLLECEKCHCQIWHVERFGFLSVGFPCPMCGNTGPVYEQPK